MRRRVIRASAAAIIACALVAAVRAADVLAQLGIPQTEARQIVQQAVTGGWLNYGLASRTFKAAPAAVRVELVHGGFAWARAYLATPEFQQAYAAARENSKPTPPAFEGTPEEELARRQAEAKAEQAKGMADLQEALKQMPPEQQKQMAAAMKSAEEMTRKLDTPQMRTMQIQSIQQERVSKQKEYADDLTKWQGDYPPTPAPLIALRLHRFLDETANVAFDAKVVKAADGRVHFADPQFEGKSDYWKVAFRAGKDAVAAARADAQAWVGALGK